VIFVRPKRTPSSVRALEQVVGRYAKHHGIAPGRIRRSISFCVLGATLDRVRTYDDNPAFVIKGGVAIEWRLRQSRATKDFDAIFKSSSSELVDALDEAFKNPYEGFVLRRDAELEDIGKALRVPIKIQFHERSWGTVPLEVSTPEGTSVPHESVRPTDLADFGLVGPAALPCIPIRRQIAKKIHALTQPPEEGRDNPRFRDLFDLWQLKDRVRADPELRAECKQIFRLRKTHTWPPKVTVYDSWGEPYRTMSTDARLAVTDVHQAANGLEEFFVSIEAFRSRIFASEFRDIPDAIAENTDLRDVIYELVGEQPIPSKVLEEPERLARFRQILEILVSREIDVSEAVRRTERYIPRQESIHRVSDRVFPDGWASELVRTQFSRFYNQALMMQLLAEGHTKCFVPHSSEEVANSPCSQQLAGREHELGVLYQRLIDYYSAGEWSAEPRIPDNPHCTHVVRPN